MANQPQYISWYFWLTVYSGSIWILITAYFYHKQKNIYILFLLLLIPFLLSILLENPEKKLNISVLSVNTEYRKVNNQNKYISNIVEELKNEKNAEFLVFPEQTLRGIDKDKFKNSLIYNYLKKLITNTSIESIVIGSTYYERGKYLANGYIFINNNCAVFRSKNKLVPLTEFIPEFLSFISDKHSFSKNVSIERQDQINAYNNILVCYEAFYSLYTLSKKNDKQKIFFILASEKFLNGSFYGKRQYNNIVRLRAIENNLNFIKVSSFANSIHVNNKGEIINIKRNEIQLFEL